MLSLEKLNADNIILLFESQIARSFDSLAMFPLLTLLHHNVLKCMFIRSTDHRFLIVIIWSEEESSNNGTIVLSSV